MNKEPSPEASTPSDTNTDADANNNGNPSVQDSAANDFPLANVQTKTPFMKKAFASSRMWMATVLCALVAIVLLAMAWGSGGTHVSISFDDGFGIKPGDTLRFRGIDVGEVIQVDVNSELDGVVVHIELQQNGVELAREGSQFWIERPQVGLARITGLDTVVGAKYIGVIPGEKNAAATYRFQGIESPPVIRDGSNSEITVEFDDGHGITSGDVVRHLGIVIGEVTGVAIADRLDSVTVRIRLAESAAKVARAGSQFWIERPELGLDEIRGLETLVRGAYIDFLPGPEDGPLVQHFQGVSHAPPATRLAEGLEVVLTSNQQQALKPGVPVKYRGLEVGHVVSVGLASDASSVQARIYIKPDYKSLVRINSRFWSNIGLDADFSVRGGLQLKTDSLQSLAVGSIGFATPNNAGRKARTGDQFGCLPSVDPEWLEWNPQIAVGEQMLPAGAQRPAAIRATIRWDRKRIVTRSEQRQGWLLLLDEDTLLGLPRYLQPGENAVEGTAKFEMSGVEFPWDPDRVTQLTGLATYRIDQQLSGQATWPKDKLRRPTEPEDCLIVCDPQSAAVPLAASNIEEFHEDRFLVAPSISYNASLDGACVISRNDGSLLGFLDLSKGQAVVVLVSQ